MSDEHRLSELRRKIQRHNHPAKGSAIKVEPIRDVSAIMAIKMQLKNQPRNTCLFTLGINTAYRAGELLSLRIGDVADLGVGGSLEIKQHKNNKYRRISLNRTAYQSVQHWLGVHPKPEPLAPLFLSLKGGALGVSATNHLVKRWCKDAGLQGNYGSHRRELEQLQAAITFAYKQNIIESSPFIWKPEKSKSRSRWLTRKEAAALIWAARQSVQAKDYLPLFILIGIYTGARMTAILKLQWTDIDLENGIIDFTTNDKSEKKKGAKTRIPPRLIRRLRAHRKRGVEMGYVLHINHLPIKSPKKSFKTACNNAGLEDVTIHTLRHTCASWLIQNNVHPSKIAKHLGHTSSRMIEKTYGHLNENHLEEIMEVFG